MMSQAMQRSMSASTSGRSVPVVVCRPCNRVSTAKRPTHCNSFGQNGGFGRGPWGFGPGMMGNITPEQIESMIQEFAKQFGPQSNSSCGPQSNSSCGASYNSGLLVDLEEQADQYLLIADVPGLQKSDLKISINQADKTIKISGERQRPVQAEVNGESQQPMYKKQYERGMGKFQRTLSGLPKDADLSSVSARVDKGVLTIYLQKKDTKKDEININID